MRGGTGLLTHDVLPRICTFPPLRAVAYRRPCDASLTVAGQWRSFTALPVHPTSGFFSLAIYSIVKTRFLSAPRCPLRRGVSASASPWPDPQPPRFLV